MRAVGIDPSSKTGFVALDANGSMLRAKELTGVGNVDPRRMVTLIEEIMAHVRTDDVICIEGIPFATQRAAWAGGLHHGIRNELYKRGISFYDVAPNQLKKYVAVSGWIGEKGSKEQLKGNAKKQAVINSVRKHFGFVHKSDNVNDAYVLARIALQIWIAEHGKMCEFSTPEYQQEVVRAVMV